MIRLFLLLSIFLSPLANGQSDGIAKGSQEGRTLYHQIPTTSFRCEEQQWAGYYSDPEAHCQVFHICVRRHGTLEQFSFLCPNETVFHQELLVCVWWDSFDCQSASLHYGINENIFEEDEGSVGGRSSPKSLGEKVPIPSTRKSAGAIESLKVSPKSKSGPTVTVVEDTSLAPNPVESNFERRGKTIDVTESSISNFNEEIITTDKPEVSPTTKPKLQPSPILKLIPKATPKVTADILPNRDQTVEGRALPQTAVKIDNSAVTSVSSLTPKANLDFVNNGQFIVRHDDDEVIPPVGNRVLTTGEPYQGTLKIPNQIENSDAQAIASRITPTLSNEPRSGKTLQTAKEEENTARAFPKASASQVTEKSNSPQNISKSQPTSVQGNKPRRTTTVRPVPTTRAAPTTIAVQTTRPVPTTTTVPTTRSVPTTRPVPTPRSATKTITPKSPLKTTTAFAPFTSTARQATLNLRTTTTTNLPTTTTNLRLQTTASQPFNQRRTENKINAIPVASSGAHRLDNNANLLAAQPKTTPPLIRKPASNRLSSNRASNIKLSSHDVLHELLKNITIIRAGELLSTTFNKNSRSNVKRKVDNAAAPVSSFREANSALESTQTFMSSRGVNRVKGPLHRQDQKKISNKSSVKAQNPAVEHNIRIKSSSSQDNDLTDNMLSCVYYYGSKKRPNCNLVNQRAQDLQDLGLNNLLNARSRLNKIDAKSNENDYSLSLDKESHDDVTSNRRSLTVTDENFNEVKSTQKQFSVNSEVVKNVKSIVPSDKQIEVNQILNIPNTDFSLPYPPPFVFPKVSLTKDHLSSQFLSDITSLTRNAGKPLILIVSSAEAASNEGNQKKVYINTLKSDKTTSVTTAFNQSSSQIQTRLKNFNISSSTVELPYSAKTNTKPTTSSKTYLPSTSSKTILPPASSQSSSSSKTYLPTKSQSYPSSKTYLPASSPNYISSNSYLPSSRASQNLPSISPHDLPPTGSPASDLEDGLHLAFEPPSETRDKRDSSALPPTTILFLVKKDAFLK